MTAEKLHNRFCHVVADIVLTRFVVRCCWSDGANTNRNLYADDYADNI